MNGRCDQTLVCCTLESLAFASTPTPGVPNINTLISAPSGPVLLAGLESREGRFCLL